MSPARRSKPAVRVFISYSSRDSMLAETLKDAVSGDGISCFYAPTDIEALEVWRGRLAAEIQQADVILLLYSKAAGDSDEVYKEIEQARNLNKDIWLLKDKQMAIAERFQKIEIGARYHAFIFESGSESPVFEKVLEQLNRRFGRIEVPARGRIIHKENPYPGKPYTSEDQDFFFGRDAECGQLWEDIKTGKERILFIYGPSGAGKSSLIDAGLRRRLAENRWWFSGPIQPSTEKPDSMALHMWRLAAQRLQPGLASDDRTEARVAADILDAIDQLGFPAHLFWFDHMERLLALEPARIFRFFRIAGDLLQRSDRVRLIVSFREEMLSRALRHAESLPRGSCRTWFLRRLTREGALASVILPPERKCEVTIDKELAEALVDELARPEFEDRDGNRIVAVNPVSLQLVCRRLWETGIEGLADIGGADIPNGGQGLHVDVKSFVTNALTNHLEDAIEKIALSLGGENIEQKKELIRLGLLQFVSEDRRRQQLKEEPDGNRTRVGRLQGDVIKDLYEQKLLQRTDIGLATPDYRYELVHDSLAEAINHYRTKVSLLQTLNTLEFTLRGVRDEHRGLAGIFNRNADLLAELEHARGEDAGFFDDEKEFLFRCALGNQRLLAKKPILREGSKANGNPAHQAGAWFSNEPISLAGWARLLAKGDRERFFKVLEEALSQDVDDESVQRDAIALLRQREFLGFLSAAQQDALLNLMKKAALDGPNQVREAAAVAICEVREPAGGGELFREMRDGPRHKEARGALGWVRHAADRREIANPLATAEFELQWRREPLPRRLLILAPLWWQRLVRSFGWMFFVVVLSTVLTAWGAAMAFIPMGYIGASLTMADKNAGWAKGPFHGIAGGAFWGIGISTSLMFYWVILRGGRVSPKLRDWIPAAITAAFGGFVAGLALALVIGFVFQQGSLYSAGWQLQPDNEGTAQRLVDFFVNYRHGWWTPILGAAVAVGICWSLQKVSADQRAEKFFNREAGSLQQKREAFHVMIRILIAVAKRSWRILAPLVAGGFLVFELLNPGPGICDTANPSKPQCAQKYPLAPKPARVAGIVFIIWVGGLFLETGVLFGIFVARAGVTLDRDRNFLQAFTD